VSLIDTLPDDVLLAIFDFSWDEDHITKKQVEAWQLLVQVCRRWRSVVFGSTRRLNLRLVCTPGTPAMDTLHVWPPLPLFIRCYGNYTTKSLDNIVTVLGRSNRVCQIDLMYIPSSYLENVSAAMQEPFPQLTHLELSSCDETVPALPDSFLGGCTPPLQFLWLNRIPFPALPKLLSSATHLAQLYLINISHSGYISPENMLTALCTLTNLTALHLDFQSPRSRPDWRSRRPPTPTRAVLKDLTNFLFKGVTEYLEDIVSGIDAPQLKYLDITLFNQILFDTPQLIQFIGRTPPLKALEKTRVAFADGAARINLSSQTSGSGELTVKIPCRELDWQVSAMERICASCLPPLSTLDLYIYMDKVGYWQDNIEDMLWMELLHPFTIVENLYLSKQVTPRIMPAIQELVGDRTTVVLPVLQNIFFEGLQSSGPVQEGIEQFVAARQLTSHPIAVSDWL
jgi:F-box-like